MRSGLPWRLLVPRQQAGAHAQKGLAARLCWLLTSTLATPVKTHICCDAGSLPSVWGANGTSFTHLTRLSLYANNLTGTIPAA